jgi:hypothetical protein
MGGTYKCMGAGAVRNAYILVILVRKCKGIDHLSRVAGQEIPRLLWNHKVHYSVHKSQTMDPIES